MPAYNGLQRLAQRYHRVAEQYEQDKQRHEKEIDLEEQIKKHEKTSKNALRRARESAKLMPLVRRTIEEPIASTLQEIARRRHTTRLELGHLSYLTYGVTFSEEGGVSFYVAHGGITKNMDRSGFLDYALHYPLNFGNNPVALPAARYQADLQRLIREAISELRDHDSIPLRPIPRRNVERLLAMRDAARSAPKISRMADPDYFSNDPSPL